MRAAVYSHHHIDHVFGTTRFEAEATERGWPPAGRLRPRGPARELPPLRAHARLEHGDQQAPVRHPGRHVPLAGDVPLPRRHLPRPPDVHPGRADVRAAPRPRRDRRRHVDVRARAAASSTPATCSSGPCPTPATRRRCSASPATGRRRCGRWPAAAPRSCCAGTACRSSAPTGSARRCTDTAERARHDRGPDAGADEPGRPARPGAPRGRDPRAPARAAVPAAGLRPPAVPRAQRLAALRRLVRRRARQPAAGAARRAGPRVGDAGRRARARCSPGPASWPPPATTAWPATSSSSPCCSSPARPRPTRCGPRSTPRAAREQVSSMARNILGHAAHASRQGQRDLAGDYDHVTLLLIGVRHMTDIRTAMTPDEAGLVFVDPVAYADEARFHEACARAAPRGPDPPRGDRRLRCRSTSLTKHADVLEIELHNKEWENAPRPVVRPRGRRPPPPGARRAAADADPHGRPRPPRLPRRSRPSGSCPRTWPSSTPGWPSWPSSPSTRWPSSAASATSPATSPCRTRCR